MTTRLHQTVCTGRLKGLLQPLHPPRSSCYEFSFRLRQAFCKRSKQLRPIVFQSFNAAAHGLALGFHCVIITPSLFGCLLQGRRQEVVCNGHVLHFSGAFSRVVGQNAININASHCELLDVHSAGLAHVFDLLQVCSHTGQSIIASTCSRYCIAQRQNRAAGLACVYACADKQLVCLNQRINVQRCVCCILLDLVQNGLRLFCGSKHIGIRNAVFFHCLVEIRALLHRAFSKRCKFSCKAGDCCCDQL